MHVAISHNWSIIFARKASLTGPNYARSLLLFMLQPTADSSTQQFHGYEYVNIHRSQGLSNNNRYIYILLYVLKHDASCIQKGETLILIVDMLASAPSTMFISRFRDNTHDTLTTFSHKVPKKKDPE